MRVLALQHIACEPPGVFEDVLRERGAALQRIELDDGEPLPNRSAFDAIVAMDGPMSVTDDDELRRAAARGKPRRPRLPGLPRSFSTW